MSDHVFAPDVILGGVVGSTAYGLSTPSSDVDRLGVFQVPTADVLSRWGKGESSSDSRVTKDPDVQLHELAKFFRLAAESNPTVTELLWLDHYEILSDAGALLVEHASAFLSQRARPRYIGYARSQVTRLLNRGDFDSDLKKRTNKHGRHCARLLIQARGILQSGELKVRLMEDQVDWCFEMGNLAEEEPQRFAAEMDAEIVQVDAIESHLPEEPDYDHLRQLLLEMRMTQLGNKTASQVWREVTGI